MDGVNGAASAGRSGLPRKPDDAREFAAYVGAAAPRLLRTAALLTGEAGQVTTGPCDSDARTHGPYAPAPGDPRAPAPPAPGPRAPRAPGPRAPLALALLRRALARTYASWGRLERDDPYEHTRAELVALFVRSSWYRRQDGGGPLAALPWRVRLVLVLRLYEGVAEEQVAALLGLSADRVRLLCARGVHLAPRPRAPGAAP
ncbi:sigma factor-like helix-turn-helix DNA-binding protein [Streptomyces sp. CA-253872]|uniref:sigma factor-like helix-turn-helix DNA-binding protein n=1 Tax=Streptomyces sp. CA-253872 TaxID=3240067 RepID=UPI003D8BA844